MNIYIIMHKGKPNQLKAEAWVDIDKVGDNGIYVRSVRAFLRRKDAKKWIEDKGYNHLIIRKAKII